jgi:hypothetical protein
MTLLAICQAVADEVRTLTRPATVAGNTDPDAVALLRYANRIGTRLMKAYAWQALRKEITFAALAAEEQAALPADFDRIVPETLWDRTNYALISGPASAVQWQSLKADSYSDTTRPYYAYRGGKLLILPVPAAGVSIGGEYVSQNWCTDSADDDLSLLEDDLMAAGIKYAYLTDEGQPNAAAAGDFNDYLGTLLANDQPTGNILSAGDLFGGGRHFAGAPSAGGATI